MSLIFNDLSQKTAYLTLPHKVTPPHVLHTFEHGQTMVWWGSDIPHQ